MVIVAGASKPGRLAERAGRRRLLPLAVRDPLSLAIEWMAVSVALFVASSAFQALLSL